MLAHDDAPGEDDSPGASWSGYLMRRMAKG